MSDRRKLIEKIRNILKLAEGEAAVGNTATAANMAARVQEILDKHKLTMSDVELSAQDADDPMGKGWWIPTEHGLPQTNHDFEWQQFLAASVAEAHYCGALGWS